jgi:hypothetical protein
VSQESNTDLPEGGYRNTQQTTDKFRSATQSLALRQKQSNGADSIGQKSA